MPQEILAARPRVMIVHHAADFALKLADWIAAHGYEAAIARDVEDMLELLHEARPDGVLLDLHLRALGGMQVLRLIKAIHPQVPVVTITEGPLNELALLSVKAGACGFLLKPFELQHMSNMLEIHMRRTSSDGNPSDTLRHASPAAAVRGMALLGGEAGR
jgi:DNA-binding response OmpR family regulator